MGKLTAANGTGFDLVFVSGPFVQALQGLGYAAELDHSQIPNLANLDPEATQLAFDPGNTTRCPTRGARRASATEAISSRDAELLGGLSRGGGRHRSEDDDARHRPLVTLQPALLSLGYSVNTTDPAEIDEAKAWTMEAKENLLAFDDTTFYSKLASGEASLVHAWDGWCERAARVKDRRPSSS